MRREQICLITSNGSTTRECAVESPGKTRNFQPFQNRPWKWGRTPVGTSGIVTPAADIPEIALAAGATVIHVILEDVSLGNANELMLIGSASAVMPALLKAAFPTA